MREAVTRYNYTKIKHHKIYYPQKFSIILFSEFYTHDFFTFTVCTMTIQICMYTVDKQFTMHVLTIFELQYVRIYKNVYAIG